MKYKSNLILSNIFWVLIFGVEAYCYNVASISFVLYVYDKYFNTSFNFYSFYVDIIIFGDNGNGCYYFVTLAINYYTGFDGLNGYNIAGFVVACCPDCPDCPGYPGYPGYPGFVYPDWPD